MVIDLAATTQITTSAAAGNLADAVRSDLEDPAMVQQFRAPGLWFVQLHDVVTTAANGVHYDTAQTGGVTTYTQSFENGMLVTTVGMAGTPRGRYATWKRIGSGNAATTEVTAPAVVSSSATFRENVVGALSFNYIDVVATFNDVTQSVKIDIFDNAAFTGTLYDTAESSVTAGAALSDSFNGIAGLDRDLTYYVRFTPYTGPLVTGAVTGTAGDFSVANTSNLPAPTDTATVEWDVSTPGQWKANVVGTPDEVEAAGESVTTLSFFEYGNATEVFTAIPNAQTEQTTRMRRAAMLAGRATARLVANIVTAPTGNEVARVGYSVDGTSYTDVTESDLALSITGVVRGPWFAVPTAMQGDVNLRVTTALGDGTRTAALSSLALQASPTTRTGGQTPPPSGGGGGSGATIWDDNFDTGTSIDTTGSRFASAQPWTLLQPGTSSYAVSGGNLILTPQVGSGTYRAATMPIASGDWTFETKVVSTVSTGGFAGAYLVLHEEATGKMLHHGIGNDGGFKYQVRRWLNLATWWANYGGTSATLGVPVWLDASRSGSTLTFRYSTNGTAWTTLATVAQTDDFTTAPDRVGIAVMQRVAFGGGDEVGTFAHFLRTA
jgi:hypothetical protein